MGNELEGGQCVEDMKTEMEEGKKGRREGREMWWKVYRRVGVEMEWELGVGMKGFWKGELEFQWWRTKRRGKRSEFVGSFCIVLCCIEQYVVVEISLQYGWK